MILGCGRVGAALAHSLEKNGHSVAIIDQNPESFRRLAPTFTGKKVTGLGFDRDTLEQAGIDEAYAFAAVSDGDNSNILAARVVRETYGLNNVVARIYDQGRAEVYERLGVPSVATVRWAADQVLRRLLPEGSEPQWRDPSGQVRLIQLGAHDEWVGQRVTAIEAALGARIPFLSRFGQGMIPSETTILQDGDMLYIAATNEDVPRIEGLLAEPPVRI